MNKKEFVLVESHPSDGLPRTEEGYTVYSGALGSGYEVKLMDFNTLYQKSPAWEEGSEIVGVMGCNAFTSKVLNTLRKKEMKAYAWDCYPLGFYKGFYKRHIFKTYVKNYLEVPGAFFEEGDFIKPVHTKEYLPQVVFTEKEKEDVNKSLEKYQSSLCYVSECIKGLKSEWRVYVGQGKILKVCNYSGDVTVFPDIEVVKDMIKQWNNAPIAYGLDVGVAEEGTLCIEVNDFISLGNYGLDRFTYTNLLISRFKEIKSKFEI